MVAAGVIGAGVNFYGANDGKVSAVVSGSIIGKALEASTSDGEVIEGLFA